MLNQQQKIDLLRSHLLEMRQAFPGAPPLMIETGIWNGRGSGHALIDLADVWMIDIDEVNCARARDNTGLILAFCGDSATVLPALLSGTVGPVLFWLDAHLVQEHDADRMDAHPCPLLAELDAVLAWPHAAQSTVLIDDVRCLGVEPTWPTMDEVLERIAGGPWRFENADDILRLTPVEA